MIKKFIIKITLIFTLLASIYAEERPFNQRVFDFTVEVPVNLSNNLINVKDIFKPEVIIDLTKIADELSDDGFSLITNLKPKISFGIEIPNGLILKFNVGAEIYSSVNIGKSLFDFLGHGNNLNEELNIKIGGYADLFAFVGIDVGFNTRKMSFVVSPSIYSCLVHFSAEDSKIVISNSNSGDFAYLLKGDLNLYSDVLNILGTDLLHLNFENINYLELIHNFGFDIGFSASYNLYRYLTVYAKASIPIFPSEINYKLGYKLESSMSTSLTQISSGEFTPPSFNFEKQSITETKIKINRPMKFNISGKFHPFNGLMDYTGGIGIGFEHPFAEDGLKTDFYIDYLLAMRFGFWNILNFNLSTERTDKIYIHKFEVDFNIRMLELAVGISAESSDFVNSLKLAGLGAYFKVSTGL